MNKQVTHAYSDGLKSLKGKDESKVSIIDNPRIKKSILLSAFMLIGYKINEQTEWSFRNVIKNYGPQQSP